ncbi:MAG: amino acid permease [Bacteroidetes bacterium]|nr:amino acid permease [Bacteroidota bacterium]
MSVFRKKSISNILQNAEQEQLHGGLAKHLGVKDLTALGIAAIVGAGIFSTIGKASADGGPGVIFLFIFTALACSFAAFAYAEFASLIPVSGSAYTYSYVAFGELFAWIIGWALIMEYAIGNVTVAISWSDYFTSLVGNLTPYEVQEWLRTDYFTAHSSYEKIYGLLIAGVPFETLKVDASTAQYIEGFIAYGNAPKLMGMRIIFDLPALIINLLITILVYRGIKESKNAGNAMVLVKLAIVLLVIFVGAFYIDTKNWNPFFPNKIAGLLKGVSAVFFAYIGFDAISTTAEECKNPQRDLPKGIMYSIIICTVLYVAIALVITGIVNYSELAVGDPLAYVFEKIKNLKWLSGVIAFSAVIAMASVMLVFQIGQPRIWMSMSRDGLLPKAFSKIHPVYKTPSFSTIFTGILVALPIFFVDINMVTDMCSAGTLFAFILVCGGVIKLSLDKNAPKPKFKTPYINSKYILPAIFIITICLFYFFDKRTFDYYLKFESAHAFLTKLPVYIFILGFGIFSVMAFKYSFSLIPSLGLLCCFYMLSQLGYKNWIYFSAWVLIGLAVYFIYGYKHSKLRTKQENAL